MHLQQIVINCVKAYIDALIEEEIRLGTEIEKNDFKASVQQFAEYMETITQDIDDSVKSCQQKAAENLKAVRLENALIFQIND